MHPKQNRIIQDAKFTYSPLGKSLEKQTKIIEDKWKEQFKASQSLGLNNHQIQPYQPKTKSIEDILLKDQLNQEA